MEDLRRHFALVDAGFCFVGRRVAAPSVRSVLRVANSFCGAQLTRQNLLELAEVAPELLVLRRPNSSLKSQSDDVFSPTPATEEDFEVVMFPLAPQTSQRASDKRKTLFDEALKKNFNSAKKDTSDCTIVSSVAAKKTSSPTTGSGQQIQVGNDWGSSVLTMLQQTDIYRGQIVHVERRSARKAQYRDLGPLELSPQVCEALDKCYSIKQLYSHQFEAIEAIRRGDNAVLSTATASGKSLAYNVPMLDTLLEDPSATFMYLFPTKALAQDQLKSLRRLLEAADLPLHIGATFVRVLSLLPSYRES
jgi:superfamily II RNA helicase